MKFEGALKLLIEKKKVTEKTYHKGACFFIGEQERLEFSYDGMTSNTYAISLDDILAGDWEEYKEPIFDDVEKKHLEAALRPFKNRVLFILKDKRVLCNKEYLSVFVEQEDNMDFPNFPAGTMYKGMELGKYYTLEELGLFQEESND